jgi:SAM-dependent methyltransferase
MVLNQQEQDRIWSHVQNEGRRHFDLSYPRLRFFAERCAPRARVLNIGVGTGLLEELLVRRDVETWSLDPSHDSINRLRTGLPMGERAQQGYSQAIPFADDFFDKVIMTEVLEHLPTAVFHATLDEVRRVLKPGGEFTGTVPYREDLAAGGVVCPRCETQFHRWGHEQRFDEASLGALLKEHGFHVEHLHARAFPDFRRRGLSVLGRAVFRYVLGWLGEPLVGPNLYFRARRPASSSVRPQR